MKHFIKQVFSLQFLISKPLIVLLITAGCGLWTEINAQYRQDRSIIRGNVTSITIKYPGDITTDSLFLQVRTTSSFTSTIHIAKENTVAGGSDAEILATYSYPYTTVKIFFSSANTSGLAIANYYYDLRKSVSPDSAVLIYGTFKIQSYAGEVVNGLAGGGSNESIIKSWIGDSADVIRMELADYVLENDLSDSLDNIRTLIGTGGVALPDSVLFSTDSTAQRTFSDLKYVDKASTQTITGEKTFSNSKTVFGTTTNDSVGVRGRINVGRKITVGSGNNLLSFDNATLLSGGAFPEFNLKLNDPTLSPYQMSLKFDYLGMLTLVGTGIYVGLPSGNLSYNGGTVNSSDINWLLARDYAIYSMNGLRTDGDIYVDSGDIYVNGDINVIGNYYRNGVPITASGSVGNADSLGALPASAYVTKSAIDGWSTNLYTGSANVMRLGKSYNDKRFNNGAYSDVWNIDYVVPPYNLSASWLFPIEHRTDYYNDTLQTVSGVANLLKIDGTGTPIWKSSTVTIAGQETQVNIGDLPDSTTLNYSASSTIGNNVILSEENMTASETRYPMQIKGYNFRLGTNNNYILPKLYSYYSDLSTGNIEDGYHFYGNGNYPSYFGGNIYTDGYLRVQDSIIIGTSTVKIYPDSITIGGTRVPKITEITTFDSTSLSNRIDAIPIVSISYPDANTIEIATGESIILDPSTLEISGGNLTVVGGTGGLDTSVVNALIEANEDSSGQSIIGTTATLDSIITDYWNDALGGSLIDTAIVNALIEANEDTSGSAIIGTTETLDSLITDYWNDNLGSGGTPFDSTYAYQRITALEDSITAFRSILNSILAALDDKLDKSLLAGGTTDQVLAKVDGDDYNFTWATIEAGEPVFPPDVTPPNPPTGLEATATSSSNITLNWTDPADGDLDSIRIYEYKNATEDSTAMTWIASVGAGVETYNRGGLDPETTYWYRLKAIDDSSNVSWFSNADSSTTFEYVPVVSPFYTIDFEEGDLSEWTSTSGANLSASTTFAHGGTYSMRVGTNSYGILNFTANDTIFATFEIYLPSTTSQSANYQYISLFNDGETGGDKTAFGTNGWNEWIVGENSGSMTDGDFTTNFSTNTWHTIKVKYITNGSTTSQHQVWVDGTSIWSATSNDTENAFKLTLGSQSVTLTGFFYVDDIKLYYSDPDL